MRVLVCGSRDWEDEGIIFTVLLGLLGKHPTLIHGAARGADRIAGIISVDLYGKENVETYPAKWEEHGKAAGVIRNQQMLDAKPDVVYAFNDNLAESKGTADMVRRAKKAGIPVYVIAHA